MKSITEIRQALAVHRTVLDSMKISKDVRTAIESDAIALAWIIDDHTAKAPSGVPAAKLFDHKIKALRQIAANHGLKIADPTDN